MWLKDIVDHVMRFGFYPVCGNPTTCKHPTILHYRVNLLEEAIRDHRDNFPNSDAHVSYMWSLVEKTDD